MTPKEQKDLIMGYRKYLFLETDKNSEEIIDAYLATLTPTSERYKATMAFFDKLPDGLREMAKENYEEDKNYVCNIITIEDALCSANWRASRSKMTYSDWAIILGAIVRRTPSITLNGTTYDLTKCYEN
jgi:hypothetical protein